MKVLSIWDQKVSSEDLVEQLLIDHGIELKSYVRELDINTVTLKPWLSYQSEKSKGLTKSNTVLEKVKRLFSFLEMQSQLSRDIQGNNPEILLFHFGQTGARFIKIAKRQGIRCVVVFYGHDISAALRSRRWQYHYRKLSKSNATIIVLCEEARLRLIDFGFEPNRIIIWNLPLKFDFPIRDKPIAPEKSLHLLTAGRFVEKKGYPTLFEVMRKLNDKGLEVQLHIFGYGDGLDKIRSLAANKGVLDRITWSTNLIGEEFQRAYLAALRVSDIFVLASETAKNGDDEGGPALTLVTAQAVGIPVVTTSFPGHEITVINEETGFICENPVVDNMVLCLERFQNEVSLYQNVGVAGADKARVAFDQELQIQKFIGILLNPK